MKKLLVFIVVASAFSIPALAHAESDDLGGLIYTGLKDAGGEYKEAYQRVDQDPITTGILGTYDLGKDTGKEIGIGIGKAGKATGTAVGHEGKVIGLDAAEVGSTTGKDAY